jgi:regulator of sigma E protease
LQVLLTAVEDVNWPVNDRGLLFSVDKRLQKAKDFADAVAMGVDTTTDFIVQVYAGLRSLATRRVSPDHVIGPIGIGMGAFALAGSNVYQFIIFLGLISVNLAVVNFLPIPILDGGHMVFLTWEAVRGKPASEQVRAVATYVGLFMILCLMVFVVYMDVIKFII